MINSKSNLIKRKRIIYRKAKKNQEFDSFFSEFKDKNKDKWSSIINGMDITDDIIKQETEEEKKDEIVMLKELSNRRKFKNLYDEVRREDRVYLKFMIRL